MFVLFYVRNVQLIYKLKYLAMFGIGISIAHVHILDVYRSAVTAGA